MKTKTMTKNLFLTDLIAAYEIEMGRGDIAAKSHQRKKEAAIDKAKAI